MAQDGPQDTAEEKALPAVAAGTIILANKKVRLTDWNRLKFHIWLNGLRKDNFFRSLLRKLGVANGNAFFLFLEQIAVRTCSRQRQYERIARNSLLVENVLDHCFRIFVRLCLALAAGNFVCFGHGGDSLVVGSVKGNLERDLAETDDLLQENGNCRRHVHPELVEQGFGLI